METSRLRPQTALPLVDHPPLRQVNLNIRDIYGLYVTSGEIKLELAEQLTSSLEPDQSRATVSDLVGADDKHDAVHVGLRAHLLLHLAQPAVEGVEALPEADVVNQQDPLAVLIELVTHLRDEAEGNRTR